MAQLLNKLVNNANYFTGNTNTYIPFLKNPNNEGITVRNPNGYTSTNYLRQTPSAPNAGHPTAVQSAVDAVKAVLFPSTVDSGTKTTNTTTSSSAIPSNSALKASGRVQDAFSPSVYIDAPLATKYGMDASTAFQEEMANTAHQRDIADLKAAGLNPVLSAKYGGSAVFAGTEASIASGYTSGKSSSSEEYTIGNLVGDAITIATHGRSAIGRAVGNIIDFSLNSAKSLAASK